MSFTDLPRIQTNEALVIAGASLALVVIVYLILRGIRRWQTPRVELNDPAPLLIPVQRRGSAPPPLYPTRFGHERPGSGLGGAESGASAGDAAPIVDHAVASSRNGNGVAGGAMDGPPNFVASATRATSGTSSKIVHTIPPLDGTLQFLPGRLEILDGDSPGRDIRFVRTWGEVPEITFGRVSGPPFRHVQLRSQTVSRQHARMQYVDGRWKMTNLSQTNPVVINGQPLDGAHGNRVLRDGDQIEMGEVVFRFRER